MSRFENNASKIAARINAGRQTGLANVTGTTPEEIRESFLRTFRDPDLQGQQQVEGFHDHTKKKPFPG